MTSSQHVYEVRPRKDKRGVDLISDALPFDRRCEGRLFPPEHNRSKLASSPLQSGNTPDLCIGKSPMLRVTQSTRIDALIRVYDDAGNVIETQAHKGDFKEW